MAEIRTVSSEKKRKEKTTPFGVNLMRSQVLYQAAQETVSSCMLPSLAYPHAGSSYLASSEQFIA